jgi:hydroxyacylglutathione hydrolase
MEEYNMKGAPLLSELSYPEPLTLGAFEEERQQQNMIVMDTRLPYSFAGAHIPSSLSIWLGGTSVYPGWLLDTNQYIVFVLERSSDINIVAPRLRRLGFDNMCGYLCGGMNKWQESGKPIISAGAISVTELKGKLEKSEVLLFDVREPGEWKDEGIVEAAKCIFFAELTEKVGSLPKDKPIAVMCSVGNRASIAVSILERAGFKNVSNVLGGMNAWTNLGYPVRK